MDFDCWKYLLSIQSLNTEIVLFLKPPCSIVILQIVECGSSTQYWQQRERAREVGKQMVAPVYYLTPFYGLQYLDQYFEQNRERILKPYRAILLIVDRDGYRGH